MYSLHFFTIAEKSWDGLERVNRYFKISEDVGTKLLYDKKSRIALSHFTILSGGNI
jgi:hypothetical protein